MKKLFKEIVVVVANLKDLIFSLWDFGSDKKVSINPYDKRLTAKGELWLKKIKKIVPDLKVSFVGSSALKLPGQKDIDYIIESSELEFEKNIKRVSKLFGRPAHITRTYAEWFSKSNGVNIEIFMSNGESRMLLRMMDAFLVLKNHKHLYQKYLNLKLSMNGKSRKEYELRRSFFFNEVFYKYGRGLDFITNISFRVNLSSIFK